MSPSEEPRILPCLACGVEGKEGRDVMFKLVEVPPDEQRVVPVVLPAFAATDSLQMPVEVRERYVSEPRCRDEKACRRRVQAYLDRIAPPSIPAPPPAAAPADPPAEAEKEYVL